MSDATTYRMLNAYLEKSAQKPGFLTSYFQTPERNFFKSEKVEIDIKRAGHQIAPVLTSLAAGLNRSENSTFVNKEFTPAIYGEEFSVSVRDSIKRSFGQDPYKDPSYLASLQLAVMSGFDEQQDKIRRGIELQCAQVLRSGVLTLPGAGGTTAFTLDYKPKATHFPGAEVDWDENSGVKAYNDVLALTNVIWQDGNHRPLDLVFGESAFPKWLADATVKEQLVTVGTGIGNLQPPEPRNGGVFHGRVSIGQFVCNMWTYPGFYNNLTNGAATKYVQPWDVLVLSEGARLDLVYGDIPLVSPPLPVPGMAVGRVSSPSAGIDLITNSWMSLNGHFIYGSVEARPLAIPTAIDTFGCLNAKVS